MSVYLRMPTYEKRPLVKAIVFYGRRYTARLLNCYLERNMLKSGGLFSEVRRKHIAVAESVIDDCVCLQPPVAAHLSHGRKQSSMATKVIHSRLQMRADAVHGRFCSW